MGNCLHNKDPSIIPTMAPLTTEQIEIIQTTWAVPAANAVDSGEAVLLAYFERFPKNQQKFHAFKNVPLLSLKVIKTLNRIFPSITSNYILDGFYSKQGTPGFRTHAGRVALAINEAIECLNKENYEQELDTLWTKLGESHNRRNISRQAFNVRCFFTNDLRIPMNCCLQCILQELRIVLTDVLIQVCDLDDTQQAAWGIFFDTIYHILFQKIETLTYE